ncbi:MAG: hypothetical protein V7640_2587 [Betaproteobacteria bacterium]|jgi:hypothetical protein
MNGIGPDTSRLALWKAKHRNADRSEGLGDRIARAVWFSGRSADLVSSPQGPSAAKKA